MTKSIAKRCILTLSVLALTLLMTNAAYAQTTLKVTLTPGTDVNGEPSYTATVQNTGIAPTVNLNVTFTMPFWELPIAPPPSGGCLFSPGPFHWTAVCTATTQLNPGSSQDFLIVIHPTGTSPQDVTAVATEAGGGTDSAFVTSTITGVGLTEMLVTMTSTNPGKVGEALVYTVTVLNIQDDDARNVFAVLAVPKSVTFVSASRGCSLGTLVTCKLGQMSPGVSKTVTITVLPKVSGWTQATAGVRLSTPDRDPTNNSAATSIWVSP